MSEFLCNGLMRLFAVNAGLRQKQHGFFLKHCVQRQNFGSTFNPRMTYLLIALIIMFSH